MNRFKDWLILSRVHTANATMSASLLGVWASGSTNPIHYIAIGLWTLWFHGIGFIANSVWDLPWDLKDPEKSHFPTVSGAIPQRSAYRAVVYGTIIGVVWSAIMIFTFAWGHPLSIASALLVTAGAVLLGWAYTVWSKRQALAHFYIAGSFGLLVPFGYFTAGGNLENVPTLLWYITAYITLISLHVNMWPGCLKDLATDPVSLLRSLGATADRWGRDGWYAYHLPPRVWLLGIATRFSAPALAIAFVWPHLSAVFLVFLIGLAMVHAASSVSGVFLRKRILMLFGLGEAFAFFLLFESLETELHWVAYAWMAAAMAWFMALNKFLWNDRLIGPKV